MRTGKNASSAGMTHFEKEKGTIRKRSDGVEPACPGTGSAAITPGNITGEARQYAGLLPRILHLQKKIAVRFFHIAIRENHRALPFKGKSKVGGHRGFSGSPLAGSNGDFHEENLPVPLGFVGHIGRRKIPLPDTLQHVPYGALAILKNMNSRRRKNLKSLGTAETRSYRLGSRIYHVLSRLDSRSLKSVQVLFVGEIFTLLGLGITKHKPRGPSKPTIHERIQAFVLGYTDCDFHRILPSESSKSTSTAASAAAETISASASSAKEASASSEEGKRKRSVLRGIIHRSLRSLRRFLDILRRHLLCLGGRLLLRSTAKASSPSRKRPLAQRPCSIACWHSTYLPFLNVWQKELFVLSISSIC